MNYENTEEINDREQKRLGSKPNIDNLEPGVVDQIPAFKIKDRIIAERYSSCLENNHWLDTRTYTVLSIQEDGTVMCMDDELRHTAILNYKSKYCTIKLCPKNAPPAATMYTKKGRGRPKGSRNKPKI